MHLVQRNTLRETKIKEVKPDTAEHITYKLNRNRQHNNRETWSFAGSLSDPLKFLLVKIGGILHFFDFHPIRYIFSKNRCYLDLNIHL